MTGMVNDNPATERVQEIKAQLDGLAGRDLQLWSIGFLIMVLLAVAALSGLVPQWSTMPITLQVKYVPQLATGLVALVLLLNFYLIEKRRVLTETRLQLVREMTLNETLERFSFLDPGTELFTRNYLPHLLSSEAKRCNRDGRAFTMMVISVAPTCASAAPGERLSGELSRLLRRTFRGSDTIITLGSNRFLVVLPATGEKEAKIALNRLNSNIDDWNLNTPDLEVLLNCALRSCRPGEDPWTVLRDTEQQQHDMETSIARLPAETLKPTA